MHQQNTTKNEGGGLLIFFLTGGAIKNFGLLVINHPSPSHINNERSLI